MINRDQGNDAVAIRTKLIDQHSFGCPTKRGANNIVDRRPIMQFFLANDHNRHDAR